MAKYRKIPEVIEAIQWDEESPLKIINFVGAENLSAIEYHCIMYLSDGALRRIYLNDYIIKGVNGEFYPCKPDIFEKTYEKVED